MKRAMRCHDFGSGREASRSQYLEYWQGERQSPGPKLVPAPGLPLDIQMPAPGLRPKSATRRTVEQGPRLRGCDRVGACESRALRRSTVPLRGAGGTWSRGPACGDATVEPAVSASCPALCASPGSDPQRGPSSALRRAIQAHNTWNLLRPARDTLSAGLAIFAICPAPSFASTPILARNARVFHHVRDSRPIE